MERALAHVEVISHVQPCPNADNLDLVRVLGWQCVAKKGEFQEGDKCVYFEIDSRVDTARPGLEFMQAREGKVKTIKLRGNLSQGLAITFSTLKLDPDKYEAGQDVTEELNVKKIQTSEERRIQAEDSSDNKLRQKYRTFLNTAAGKFLMKHKITRKILMSILKLISPKKSKNNWPDFITKTDEARIENMPSMLENKVPLIATEKLDGTSTTFAICKKRRKYEFIVCSRNVRQLTPSQKCFHETNTYWEMANKYQIETVLNNLAKHLNFPDTIVLQGETIGNVQGNPYKLSENRFYAFNLIVNGLKYSPVEGADTLRAFGIEWVPILNTEFICPDTMEEMKELADGKSLINPNVLREGMVLRSKDSLISFKNVSNKYLLKHQL